MRLFIAIQLSPELRKTLLRVQDELRRRDVEGNYSREENLHLTLAFIGEYPDPDAVLEAMETLRFAPFTLRLEGLGAFESLWWAGLDRSEELYALDRQLRHALADAGIPFDRQRFRPHITLLRRPRCRAGEIRLGELAPAPVGMRVDRITLFCSTQGRNGRIYTELGSVRALTEERRDGA